MKSNVWLWNKEKIHQKNRKNGLIPFFRAVEIRNGGRNTMEFTKRQIDILKFLQRTSISTSAEIAKFLNVSSKTIKNEIKEINSQVNSILVCSEKGHGYHLSSEFDFSQIFQETTDRHFLILRKLLSQNNVDFYELADSLYISEATLSKDISEINSIIKKRNPNIKVERRQNKVFISGSESARRQVSAYFLLNELDDYNLDLKNYNTFFTEFNLEELKQYVLKFNKDNHVKMKDLETLSFVIHVAIMLDRIVKGNVIPPIQDLTLDQYFIHLALEFECGLKSIINIDFSNDETNYLACLFSGKMSSIKGKSAETIQEFVYELLKSIKEQFEVDLTKDEGLVNNLQLHIMSLKNRLDNDTFLNNPLIEDIKKHFPVMYDISVFMASKIQSYFDQDLKESEIGYLTLHLMGAVERMKTTSINYRVVIISPIGESMNGYLRKQIQDIREISIEICSILSMFDLEKIDNYSPDLLVSMVPINSSINYPIYICNGLLDNQDKKAIINKLKEIKQREDIGKFFEEGLYFYQSDFDDKKSAIKFLCKKLEEKGYTDEQYLELVLKREDIAPTAYGGMIAVPHPIEKKGFVNKIAVCVLKDKITWNDQQVKIIFLFSLNKQKDPLFEYVFEQLVFLIDDKAKVKKLCQAKTLENFLEIFKNK